MVKHRGLIYIELQDIFRCWSTVGSFGKFRLSMDPELLPTIASTKLQERQRKGTV